MLSQLGKFFDPFGIFSCFFFNGRLILQRLSIDDCSWDKEVSESVAKEWHSRFANLKLLLNILLARRYFGGSSVITPDDDVTYQLHDFDNASDDVFGAVVYIRRIVNDIVSVFLVFGKSRVALKHQKPWPIACKEPASAVIATELLSQAKNAVKFPNCTSHLRSNSCNVLQRIKNPDLRLDKFISRRV